MDDPAPTHTHGAHRLLELIERHRDLHALNSAVGHELGWRGFFEREEEIAEMQEFLTCANAAERVGPRVHGDVQTGYSLARRVCMLLRELGARPRVIVEPTCGHGVFMQSALDVFPEAVRLYGVELQREHVLRARAGLLGRTANARVEIHHDDIFTHTFPEWPADEGEILIVGNPPWITSAELGGMGAVSGVVKSNRDGAGGMDALTGRSNFDMAEAVICRMLDLFSQRSGYLAMLCKNAVIKRIVEYLPRRGWRVGRCAMYTLDAGREFGVAVDAGLLVLRLGEERAEHTCTVASLHEPGATLRTFGWYGGRLVADRDAYTASAALDGRSPFEWRQGVKHDCADVVELRHDEGLAVNGYGEPVEIESDYLYPFLKSSDLTGFEVTAGGRLLVLTQRHPGDRTATLEQNAPKLWAYLEHHREHFQRRRSKVYRGAPPFAMFGVGEYSFLPWKIAVSGLYKRLRVALVPPVQGRPVMVDDTCYTIGFAEYGSALFTASLLHHEHVRQLLASIVFSDAKRPYTKSVMMRIDLATVAEMTGWEEICGIWERVGYRPRGDVSAGEYARYREQLRGRDSSEWSAAGSQ